MAYKKFIGLIGCGYWGKNLARDLNYFGVLSSVSDTNQKAKNEVGIKYPKIFYFLLITKKF